MDAARWRLRAATMAAALLAAVLPLGACAANDNGHPTAGYSSPLLESDIARRFRAVNSDEDADEHVLRVAGPIRIHGKLDRAGPPVPDDPTCGDIKQVLKGLWDYSPRQCASWPYRNAMARNGIVYLVDYVDGYPDTESFRSFSGHLAYRPPFAAGPGLISYDELCGEFVAFDLVSNHSVRRLIITQPTARPCTSAQG